MLWLVGNMYNVFSVEQYFVGIRAVTLLGHVSTVGIFACSALKSRSSSV